MPDLSQYHIDKALQSLSILAQNTDDSYLWNRGSAQVPVLQSSGKYFVYGREVGARQSPAGSVARSVRSLRTLGSEAAEVDYTLSTQSYSTTEYALRDFVSDAEIRDSEAALAPLMDTATELRNSVMNDAEQLAARIMFDGGNYNAGNKLLLTTGASGTTWANSNANSDPLGNIRAARSAIKPILQREPNTLILTDGAAKALAEHAEIKGVLQYTDSRLLMSGQGIPNPLRGLNILIGGAVGNTAAEGAAYSGQFLVQDYTAGAANVDAALVCYVPPGQKAGLRTVSSFLTLLAPDATTGQRGVTLRSWRDEKRKGWIVEAAITMDVRFPFQDGSGNNTGAYLIRGCSI